MSERRERRAEEGNWSTHGGRKRGTNICATHRTGWGARVSAHHHVARAVPADAPQLGDGRALLDDAVRAVGSVESAEGEGGRAAGAERAGLRDNPRAMSRGYHGAWDTVFTPSPVQM